DRVASMPAPQPGRVVEVLVKENDEVKKDQPLLRMDDRDAKLQLTLAQKALEAARIQFEKAKNRPDQHRLQLAQLRDAIRGAEERVQVAKQTESRMKRLAGAEAVKDEEVKA